MVNCSPHPWQDLEHFTHCPKLWVFLVWPLGTGTIPRLVCMTVTVTPNPLGWFFSWARIDFLYACVLLVGPMNSSCVSLPDSADFFSSGHQPARPAIQFAGPSVKWKCRPFVKIIQNFKMATAEPYPTPRPLLRCSGAGCAAWSQCCCTGPACSLSRPGPWPGRSSRQ